MRAFVLADDYTGACDAGVQLRRLGEKVRVGFSIPKNCERECSIVIDSETRNTPEMNASVKIRRIVSDTGFNDFDLVIKKVDSTLRGNIAAEIAEIDKAYKSDLVVFMPALPSLGRTTVDSVQFLNGIRILDTEIAKDTRKPALCDNIYDILSPFYKEEISKLRLDDIRESKISFAHSRVWCCDAETAYDMSSVIDAVKASGYKRVLWVGTAAIVDALSVSYSTSLPALAVVTSTSDVMISQLHWAMKCGLSVLSVEAFKISSPEEEELFIENALKILQSGKNLAIVSSASIKKQNKNLDIDQGAVLGMNKDEVAEFVCEKVTRISAAVIRNGNISGVFMSGGDTAYHLLKELYATQSELLCELADGIPMIQLIDGEKPGLKIVTKAGAFGEQKILPFVMRKLRE